MRKITKETVRTLKQVVADETFYNETDCGPVGGIAVHVRRPNVFRVTHCSREFCERFHPYAIEVDGHFVVRQ